MWATIPARAVNNSVSRWYRRVVCCFYLNTLSTFRVSHHIQLLHALVVCLLLCSKLPLLLLLLLLLLLEPPFLSRIFAKMELSEYGLLSGTKIFWRSMDADRNRYRARSLFFLLTFFLERCFAVIIRIAAAVLFVVDAVIERGYDFRRESDAKRRVRHRRTRVQSRKRHVNRHANVLADIGAVVDDLRKLDRRRFRRPRSFGGNNSFHAFEFNFDFLQLVFPISRVRDDFHESFDRFFDKIRRLGKLTAYFKLF